MTNLKPGTLLIVYESLNVGGVGRKIVDVIRQLKMEAGREDRRVVLVLERLNDGGRNDGIFTDEISALNVDLRVKPDTKIAGLQLPFFL